MIKKLSQDVINKIAAGEIVQRPYSVVKEVVENSLDAGATNISVYLKNAGLDEIKISDNGFGIMEEDLPLLCERYATSKITEADDLKKLCSFGFRGEALASISFVSDMTVVSKRKEKEIGYKATYRNQKLLAKDVLACSDGTEIIINSLFDNLEKRREALNKSEEKKIVLQLIQSLSVHYDNVKFKLYFDNKLEFLSSSPTRIEAIAQIMKISVPCLEETSLISQIYKFSAVIVFTKLNSLKYFRELCLFINDRYVECDMLKKKLTQVYQECYLGLHSQDGGYYIYLNLKLEPLNIDPNVHPNKKLVKFINEYEISTEISEHLKSQLGDTNTQKLIQTQISFTGQNIKRESNGFKQSLQNQYQKEKIRNDPKMQTIDQFLISSKPQQLVENQKIPFDKKDFQSENIQEHDEQQFFPTQSNLVQDIKFEVNNKNAGDQIILQEQQQLTIFRISKNIRIQLQQLLNYQHHNETKFFYQNMCFVGLLNNKQQLLVQFESKLCHLNIVPMLFNMFLVQLAQEQEILGCNSIQKKSDNTVSINSQFFSQLVVPLQENEMQSLIQIAETLSLVQYDKEFIRDQVLPYFKKHQIPTIKVDYTSILRIEDLYKNFERC